MNYLQILSVWYFHFVLFHHFILYFAVYLLCWFGHWWWVLPLFLIYVVRILDDKSPTNGGGLWPYFMNHWLVEYSIRWFPLNLIRTQELDWRKQYLFGLHPHGMIPWVVLPIGRGKQWHELFPGIFVRALAASILFKIPLMREGLLWTGVVDASRFNASKALQSGSSLAVIVGGSAECLESQPNTDILILKKRKGFIRLALENGADLVPVYGYGINDLYVQMPWFKRFRQKFLAATKVALTFGIGRQYGNMFPLQRPISILIGKSIPVEKVQNPTEEQIHTLHQKYQEELRKLFEDYNSKTGENRKLVII